MEKGAGLARDGVVATYTTAFNFITASPTSPVHSSKDIRSSSSPAVKNPYLKPYLLPVRCFLATRGRAPTDYTCLRIG